METKGENETLLTKKRFFLFLGLVVVIVFLSYFINGCLERRSIENSMNADSEISSLIEVKGQSIFIEGDEVYKFLPVPGGTIMVNDSTGSRTITVESFLLGEIPVSSRLQAFVVNKLVVNEEAAENYMDFPSIEGTIEQWMDFIEKLNKYTGHKFRLPTNDEWEFAARGGKSTLNYKYAGGDNIDRVAIYKNNSSGLASFRLRSKLPNELGFYDMSGGVWELTATKIEDVFPQIKLQNTLVEITRENNPELYERIKMYKDALISRGGNYDSPENECELNYRSSAFRHKTGARLVMEY